MEAASRQGVLALLGYAASSPTACASSTPAQALPCWAHALCMRCAALQCRGAPSGFKALLLTRRNKVGRQLPSQLHLVANGAILVEVAAGPVAKQPQV